MATAVLSTTAKAKARSKKSEQGKASTGADSMDVVRDILKFTASIDLFLSTGRSEREEARTKDRDT